MAISPSGALHEELTYNPEEDCRCDSEQCQQIELSKELDIIFEPLLGELPNLFEEFWPLLTNKQPDFIAVLSDFKAFKGCTTTWKSGEFAYRCQTCAHQQCPSMSICQECFRNGSHEGHNYAIFKSSFGGGCDCGCASMMKESGFCKKHSQAAKRENQQIPKNLLCQASRAMPRLVHRVAMQLRRGPERHFEVYVYLDLLKQIANSCQVMRDIIIESLLSDKTYFEQIQFLSHRKVGSYCDEINEGLELLQSEIENLKPFTIPESWNPPWFIRAFCDKLTPSCFLDEILYWTLVYEFPENLAWFLLFGLGNNKFKIRFSRMFVSLYPRILMLLVGPKRTASFDIHMNESHEQLNRRILQISSQIFSDDELTIMLTEEEYALETIIYCIKVAIEGSHLDRVQGTNSIKGVLKANPSVVDCDNPLFAHRHLLSFTEVLIQILKLKSVTLLLLADRNLLDLWMSTICYFELMSPYKRELVEHTLYETGPHVATFLMESDFCFTPTWVILSKLKGESTLTHTLAFFKVIIKTLSSWMQQIGINSKSVLNPYSRSFHIPLHRMLSLMLQHMLKYTQVDPNPILADLLESIQANSSSTNQGCESASDRFLMKTLLHPLSTLGLYHEIKANIWTRNGLVIINQAVTYCHTRPSIIDCDMFLLQYCASRLNSNHFIKTLLLAFHAWKPWLSLKCNLLMNQENYILESYHRMNIQPEQITQMVESSLVLLIQLLTLDLYCIDDNRERMKKEMVALISIVDRPYSCLVDILADGSESEHLNSLLDELTAFKPAQHGSNGNLQQGIYSLTKWDEYDPIYVQYRFYQKKDLQLSLERFFKQYKTSRKSFHPSSLWLPLKIPNNIGNFGKLDLSPVIDSPTLVGLVYSILYKSLYITEVSDTIMAYAIHLIELSLRKCLERNQKASIISEEEQKKAPRTQKGFTGKYHFKELATGPPNFGPKGENGIRGHTLLSRDRTNSSIKSEDLFPVVKHALDLAFETSWFPFETMLDNCLIHVEDVYLWPTKDFEGLSKCETEGQADHLTTRFGGFPTDFSTDDRMEEYEEEFEEDSELDEEYYDDESTEEDEEEEVALTMIGGEDNEPTQSQLNAISNFIFNNGDRSGSDSELTDLVRRRLPPFSEFFVASSEIENENQDGRTQDRATNTGSVSSSGHRRQAILEDTTRSNVATQSSSDTRIWLVDEENDVEMISVSEEADSNSSRPDRTQREVFSEPTLQTPQQISGLTSQSRQSVSDHTYSVLTTQPMEVDSLPESLRSALELIPVTTTARTSQQEPTRDGDNQSGGGLNLVTSDRRAITESAPLEAPECCESSRLASQPLNRREEQSLTEADIQTRFMGFFQTRLDVNRNQSGSGRQMARRGGFHASPRSPFVVTNPNHNSHNSQQARSSRNTSGDVGPGSSLRGQLSPRSETNLARSRSRARNLINRVLYSRSQQQKQHQQQGYQHDQLNRNRRSRERDRVHHGDSLLSLLLRLHAKYSQRGRSYEYNEERAELNCGFKRNRIGDGLHFVTIVLDLICTLDQRMRAKLDHLQELIWVPERDQSDINLEIKTNSGAERQSSSSSSSFQTKTLGLSSGENPEASANSNEASNATREVRSATMTPLERRRRAKEIQSRLMADYAGRQKAFLEKYETTTSGIDKGKASLDEEPINLSTTATATATSSAGEAKLADRDKSVVDKSICLSGRERGRGRDEGEEVKLKGVNCGDEGSVEVGNKQRVYECCICGVEGPSDLTNPLGQVVLLQSTSVLGHSHLRPKRERVLPCDESKYLKLKGETYAKHLEGRIDLLSEHFSESSWLDSIDDSSIGGVHVSSCNATGMHYLHIECHQSYIRALNQEDRSRSRNDSDDFLCPVCRQLANSVLPILSDINRPEPSSTQSHHLGDQINLIASGLRSRVAPNQKQLESSASFCQALSKASKPIYRLVRSKPSMHSLFLFLTSIARTNLETELIVRQSLPAIAKSCDVTTPEPTTTTTTSWSQETLQATTSKKSSTTTSNDYLGLDRRARDSRTRFQLLFHVLKLNSQPLLMNGFEWYNCPQIWDLLTCRVDQKNRLNVKPINSEVPLLLRDPTTMLLQFLFALPDPLSYKANFTCLVRNLFNLVAIQSIALVLSYAKLTFLEDSSSGGDNQITQKDCDQSKSDFCRLTNFVGRTLAPLLAVNTQEPSMSSTVRNCWPRLAPDETSMRTHKGGPICFIENKVKLACLPFLRSASFIQDQLYHDQPYPSFSIVSDEQLLKDGFINNDFNKLANCLALTASRDSSAVEQLATCSLVDCLDWAPFEQTGSGEEEQTKSGRTLIGGTFLQWASELLNFDSSYSKPLFIHRSLYWFRPSLMNLPYKFEDIFFKYSKNINKCRDVAICLVCGAPICFRVSCCKDRSKSRQVHSAECGSGTAVYLAVHTSSVLVISRNRACIWGSVYLDAHDEEDNGLQRGKPLYLVQARYDLLEEQWLNHSFDHTCGKRWIHLQENQ